MIKNKVIMIIRFFMLLRMEEMKEEQDLPCSDSCLVEVSIRHSGSQTLMVMWFMRLQ